MIISSEREFPVSMSSLYRAFSDTEVREKWWGPNGFSSETEKCELKKGGEWILDMIGPNGHRYPNRSVFLEVEPEALVIYDHEEPSFVMKMEFISTENGSRLKWTMDFKEKDESDKFRAFLENANQENFDRLARVLDNDV
ncbi:MAG: hypothetical protein CMO55_01630 [Verrucomicrobiales bacterium]|nr:hypothetical protein [Verrucomicrobiales bacterium]